MLRTNSRFKYPNIPVPGAVVIVTGAARGIGAATARLFASRGAAVWLGDVDVDVLADTAASISGSHWARLDVTDAASWKSFADEVNQTSGRIDILVNNAGVMPLGSFLAEAPAIGDLTLAVNLRAPIIGTREVLPQMVKRGLGYIVTIASMAGKMAFPGMAVYNASKLRCRRIQPVNATRTRRQRGQFFYHLAQCGPHGAFLRSEIGCRHADGGSGSGCRSRGEKREFAQGRDCGTGWRRTGRKSLGGCSRNDRLDGSTSIG